MRVSAVSSVLLGVLAFASSAGAQDLEDPYADPAQPPPSLPAQPPPQPQQLPPLPAYAPLKAVGIMIETQQALFWDEQAGEYRLGKLGGEVAGWRLVAIQPDKVILLLGDARDEIPLTPAPTFYRHVPSPKRVPPVIIVAPPAAGPTQQRSPGPSMPAEPAAPPAVQEPVVTPPAPAVVPPPTVVAPPAPPPKKAIESRQRIARAELDRQLGDFDALLATVSLVPADGGGYRIVALDGKSWLASLGFKQGDIVRSVAGERVVTVDDAARVYARVLTSKSFLVEVDRGDDKLNMRFDVK